MKTATSTYTDLIVTELTRLNLKHKVHAGYFEGGRWHDFITVDRTSMVNCAEANCSAGPHGGEQACYDYVLDRLKEVCGLDAYVNWSGRTDDYLGVEVFKLTKVG